MLLFPEVMFYAEAEGLLPTRAGKINAVIKEVKEYHGPVMEFAEFEKVLAKHGFNYNDLSEREIRYINASIR